LAAPARQPFLTGTTEFKRYSVGTITHALSLVWHFNKELEIMTPVMKVLLGATAGAAILASSAITASAAIVCTGNVCWHVQERHAYPPSAGVVIHEDDWRAGPGITFREHTGRGYWKGDSWTDF
jgi:hypothetical protein